MKKTMLTLVFLGIVSSPLIASPMEVEHMLTAEQTYQLTQNTVARLGRFSQKPKNPVTAIATVSYKDKNLTQQATQLSAGNKLNIKDLLVNQFGEPIFKLADGSYIAASRSLIFDDMVYQQQNRHETFWTKSGSSVFKAPYVAGTEKSDVSLGAYKPVETTKIAQTHAGTYYFVEGAGWVSSSYLSTTDNRMEVVQNLLNEKYNNQERLSVYVKQLDTEKTAAINADKTMYAASVAKLGILYYTQDQLDSGKVSLTDKLKYTSAVHAFKGAYDPDGSGKISKKADDAEYSIEDLIKAVTQTSDNVATNILGYYVGHQYDSDFQETVDKAAGAQWNMESRELTAKSAGTMMEAIYHQNGSIIENLSSTDFDGERIAKNIPVKVAHKIGDAYDYKHDVAIVYTDSPFILSIFTDKESYDKISAIADDIYEILK